MSNTICGGVLAGDHCDCAECRVLYGERQAAKLDLPEVPLMSGFVAVERTAQQDDRDRLLDKISRLEEQNYEMASQLLDPDATCCADATRVHKEQRERIEALTGSIHSLLQVLRDIGGWRTHEQQVVTWAARKLIGDV